MQTKTQSTFKRLWEKQDWLLKGCLYSQSILHESLFLKVVR